MRSMTMIDKWRVRKKFLELDDIQLQKVEEIKCSNEKIISYFSPLTE
jgi:hypothetical protein